jgi:carboxypeptidase Taq
MTAVGAASALDRLRELLGEVSDIQRSASVLTWDQETGMPSGGVADRAAQLATLRRLAHERFTSDETARLLERAAAEVEGMDADSDEARLVHVARRDFEENVRIPAELVAARARASSMAHPVWQQARAVSDWSLFAPAMEVTVDLSRQVADALGYEGDQPYDALLAQREPGLTTARVEALFAQLRQAIVPLVRDLHAHEDRVDDSILDRPCDERRQLDFALDVIARLGYDLERGRQDISAHPFCTAFGPGDVRLTTRTGPTLGSSCLFSSIHEAGHALYNQGIPRSLDRTPLWGGASSGVHESQSRLWENVVGRGRPFWDWLFPRLRDAFPEALAGADADVVWRASSKVRPSYIRVDADEVTYNLHVMLRFEIEKDLLAGRLRVADVPEAWNELLREYLGLEAPPASQGPLQDIHWTGALGGFVGYALGNLICAQLVETLRQDLPDLDVQLAAGEFAPLLAWLRDRVHRHGRKFTPDELVERATGTPIRAEPWIAYARAKFTALYELA